MDLIAIAKMVLNILASQLPWLKEAGSAVVAVMLLISPLIELVELVASLTAWKGDDALAAKAKLWKDKIIAVLEIFPHVNIPVAGWLSWLIEKSKKAIPAIKAAVDAWKKS
jgi:hypothetical protein